MVDNRRDKEEVPIRWGRRSSILPHTFGAPDQIVNSKFLVKNADFISFYFPRNSRILFHFISPEISLWKHGRLVVVIGSLEHARLVVTVRIVGHFQAFHKIS